MTRFIAYRKSLLPFSQLQASAIVNSTLSCADSIAGKDSWSAQLNVNGKRLWIQNVLNVLNGKVLVWNLQGWDMAASTTKPVLWTPLSIPQQPFGSAGDAVSLSMFFDEPGKVKVDIGYVDGGMPRPFQSQIIPLTLDDSFYAASFDIVGAGNGSLAQFSAGALSCDLEAQGITDMAYWQEPQQNPPPDAPWNTDATDESSNLAPTLGLLGSQALKWSLTRDIQPNPPHNSAFSPTRG